jgi:hypothetical protein
LIERSGGANQVAIVEACGRQLPTRPAGEVPLAARNVGGAGVLLRRCVVAQAARQLIAAADRSSNLGTEFTGRRLNAGDND